MLKREDLERMKEPGALAVAHMGGDREAVGELCRAAPALALVAIEARELLAAHPPRVSPRCSADVGKADEIQQAFRDIVGKLDAALAQAGVEV